MDKRGELKNHEFLPKVTLGAPEELPRARLRRIIVRMLAEMQLGSGKVIASFQVLCREMLEKNYEVSWGYGKLYPFEKLKDVVAYVQSQAKGECRLLFEGKIIYLNGGFFKSDFPESTFKRINFETLSRQLLKGAHLTHWLLLGEEPEFVTVYIVPTIHLQKQKPLYFIVGETGIYKFVSGGFAEKLAGTKELMLRLASDLLRKKMLHAVPKAKLTPKTGVNVKVPFRGRGVNAG